MTTENNQQPAPQAVWPASAQYAPTTYGFPPQQQPPRRAKAKSRKRWILPAVCLVGGIILGSAGAASSRPSQSEAAPAPAPTVTATVTAEPEPAPTVTETVKETPAACLEALDLADKGFGIAATAMGYASDALGGAGNFDVAAVQAANEGMQGETAKIKELGPRYQVAKAACAG